VPRRVCRRGRSRSTPAAAGAAIHVQRIAARPDNRLRGRSGRWPRRGINHLAHEGLVKRVIGGHWGLAPRMGRLAIEGKIEAYNFPQGVIASCSATRRPAGRVHHPYRTGHVHRSGPCRRPLNERTPPGLVQRVDLGGRTWLWYKALPIDVGLIRATSADPYGNLVMDEEGLFGRNAADRQAAGNGGGLVIAQVRRLTADPLRHNWCECPAFS